MTVVVTIGLVSTAGEHGRESHWSLVVLGPGKGECGCDCSTGTVENCIQKEGVDASDGLGLGPETKLEIPLDPPLHVRANLDNESSINGDGEGSGTGWWPFGGGGGDSGGLFGGVGETIGTILGMLLLIGAVILIIWLIRRSGVCAKKDREQNRL